MNRPLVHASEGFSTKTPHLFILVFCFHRSFRRWVPTARPGDKVSRSPPISCDLHMHLPLLSVRSSFGPFSPPDVQVFMEAFYKSVPESLQKSFEPARNFTKDSIRFIKKCEKPGWKGPRPAVTWPIPPCDFPCRARAGAARISTDADLGTQNSARSPSRSRSASRSWASLASSLSLCTSLLIRLLSAATRKRVRRHPPTGCQLMSAALGLGRRRNSTLYRFPQRLSKAHPW